MNYGLPYMGSKNLIAKTLIDALPAATTFGNHPRQRFGQLDFLGQLFAEAV